MTDVIVRPEGPLLPGTDRRATIRTRPGGSGANQAAWLAHLGVAVRFAGRVGQADAAWHGDLLQATGVEARLGVDAERPSGTVVTLISPGGERSFFTDRGANCRLCAADLPEHLLDGIELVHVSGYALFEAGPRAAVLGLLAEASRRGIAASCDPGSDSFLREAGAERFLRWTAGVQLFVPNEAEAAALTGSDDPERQLEALSRQFPLVVLKRGGSGAMAARGIERWHVPAVASEVVETSGAGDAFLAGFLRAWLARAPIQACLAEAAALAAEAVRQVGARPRQADGSPTSLSSAPGANGLIHSGTTKRE